MVPAWQLDQVPLDTSQFTSIDSEVDEMSKRHLRHQQGQGRGGPVHVSLEVLQEGLDDPVELAFAIPPYEPSPFRILVQLQAIGNGRENFLRSDLMTAMAQTTVCLVLGHIDIDSPMTHDPSTGTVSFLANCAHQNVAAMWCDPMQWAAVSAAMRSHLLRLAFARRVSPRVTTVEEALSAKTVNDHVH